MEEKTQNETCLRVLVISCYAGKIISGTSFYTIVTGQQSVAEDASSPHPSPLGGCHRSEEKLRRPPGAPPEIQYDHNIDVQVLRVGPLDDESYFVLRDLQMTSKSD